MERRGTHLSLCRKIDGPQFGGQYHDGRELGRNCGRSQLSCRRLVRLIDAYETKDSMTLVTELGGGGDLVDSFSRT